jgi:signal transduction histidine kinase
MAEPASGARSRRVAPYSIAIAICAASGVAQHWLQPVFWGRFPVAVFPLAACLLLCFAIGTLQRTLRRERDRRTEAERALTRTGALEALTRALSTAQTPAEVTNACLIELFPAIGAAAGAVALVDDDRSQLDVVQAIGYADSEAVMPYGVPLASKTVLTEVARRHAPLMFMSQEDRRGRFMDLASDPMLEVGEGGVILPLLVSGRAIGTVALSYSHPHSSDDDEHAFLMSAVHRTAQALDRAMRYERAEHARADLEAYRTQAKIEIRERQRAEDALRESEARYRALAARTTRLYTLSAGLCEAVTLDAVAKAIVRQGKVVAGAAAGSVALLVDGAHFETLYAEEYGRQLVEAWHRFPAESGFCATSAVETGQPVFVGSFLEWQQQYPRSASMAADGGYASAATLPLLVENSPIGVLSFHFTAPVSFDSEYRALLSAVAHHAAQAIDRARLYEAAQHARADAEAANRSKDDFLSIVSHELRTPLSAVLGWAAMLRGYNLDAARASRAIEAIYSNATRQAHLIDELLDVSRIVAGRAPLDLQEVDLAEKVRGAVETIMPLAEANGLHLRVAQLPAVQVVADPHRLEQVFVNLLGNAVKFTPAGGTITVDVARAERSVDVRVEDTGRGIEAAFLPHVFERFRQADSTVTRSVGGLGLGLFIARCLVDAHGGRIHVQSEGKDRGAAFTVTLPLAGGSLMLAPAPSRAARRLLGESTGELASLAGVRVLLVEDESDSREMMVAILERCGATVKSASSAEAALDMLTGERGHIDVLLSDIAMPGKDGCELIREIRSQPAADLASLPAAAVTACAGADERRRVLAAGFQMHLAKPLRPDTLARAVASLAHVERV